MSLLQSALDFLAGPGSLGGAAGRDQTDFVGQTVELGELRLRVRRVLAEGEARAGCRGSARGARARGEPGGVGRVTARRARSGAGEAVTAGAGLTCGWGGGCGSGRRWRAGGEPGGGEGHGGGRGTQQAEGWSLRESSATWPFPWRRGLPRAVGQHRTSGATLSKVVAVLSFLGVGTQTVRVL